jgi:hypothetical protein
VNNSTIVKYTKISEEEIKKVDYPKNGKL